MPLPPGQPERRSGASSAAIANSERLSRLIKIVGLLLALYVALAVTAASVIGVWNSFRSVEHADDAERLAREARNQARINGDIASNVEALLAQQAPCLEGDPPDSPGCERQARSDAVVAKAIADIKDGITVNMETHDLNTKAAHDAILSGRGRTASRTPITSAPRPVPRTPATTVAPQPGGASPPSPAASPPAASPPPVTTATCPTKGKRPEHCR